MGYTRPADFRSGAQWQCESNGKLWRRFSKRSVFIRRHFIQTQHPKTHVLISLKKPPLTVPERVFLSSDRSAFVVFDFLHVVRAWCACLCTQMCAYMWLHIYAVLVKAGGGTQVLFSGSAHLIRLTRPGWLTGPGTHLFPHSQHRATVRTSIPYFVMGFED